MSLMNLPSRFRRFCLTAAAVFAVVFGGTPRARAYSVLSHEEVVDMAWKSNIVPMLRARFPGISDDDLRQAHAYAYGGSVIQDIGYYPFGSHYFSDLLHYVRPNEFVAALIRDSTTPDEYAFALGALAHYCGDTIGHPYVNQVTALENEKLRERFGAKVTYAEDPTAHVRTEFGFDVVMVAHGVYSQSDYRDFIGFQVSKDLLNKAFQQTYGVPVDSVIKHEDLAVSTYRKAVSELIPVMTKIAFVNYKDQIESAAPGTAKSKFIYRLNQTEYRKDFGKEYTHVGFFGRLTADLLKVLPKVGPLKALKVSIPDPQEQDLYLKSVNSTVDQFKLYLAQVHADPAPLPPPDPQAAADAEKAAAKLGKDAQNAGKRAEKAKDPDDKAMKKAAAADVQKTAAKADAIAAREQAKVDAPSPPTPPSGAVPPGTPIQPPVPPTLAELDMDTGKPSAAGEYDLADEAYAHLLDDLVKSAPAPAGTPGGTTDRTPIDSALANDIQAFFAHPVPPTGAHPTGKAAVRLAAQTSRVKADLAALAILQKNPNTNVQLGSR